MQIHHLAGQHTRILLRDGLRNLARGDRVFARVVGEPGDGGVHLGDALAHLTAGQPWAWPQSRDVLSSIPAVLAAEPASAAVNPRVWIVTVELLLTGSLGWAAFSTWQRWGPSRLKGMATGDQAEQVLGVRRLRKVAAIVRPDLHGRTPKEARR